MIGDPIHLILGNNGDCIIALPALKRWADAHGRPAAVLTGEAMLPLFEGCSYVKATSVPNTYHDLPSVLAYLKTEIPRASVKCLQFYGSGAPQTLPSFWHEQMYLAGLLDGSDEPLVFDLRDKDREAQLFRDISNPFSAKWNPKIILFAGKGQSSPFKDADTLLQFIRDSFPDCNVVDLSEVKAERIYDLLGLYDHAAALISIDTAHLHLSKASKVPVFALARDYPDRWHGTPQLPRFRWYCRYGQVMGRAGELVQAVRDAVEGKVRPRLQWMIRKDGPKGIYNPSVMINSGRMVMSYRYHPDRNWRTQLMLDGLPVRFPYPVSTCAHEDMRLFTFQGKLWATYVCARGSAEKPRCVVGYGELIRTEKFWAIKEHFQPDMPGNDWSGMQKNVIGMEHDGKIYLIWMNGLILEMNGGYVVKPHNSAALTWPHGDIRGGTSPLPYKGKWLRFFHSRVWPEGKPWRYHVGALLMNNEPPFETLAVSTKPIISGDESGDPMIPHWKENVVFPMGAVESAEGGWLLSLGINDAHCALLHVKEGNLNL